jgi:Zn-dependent protease
VGIVTIFLCAVVALVVHEGAHVLVIRFCGGRAAVRPFALGAVAKTGSLLRHSARERYAIYAAGALANFVLAGWAYGTSVLSHFRIPVLEQLALVSVILGVWSLLPALPLDGGHIAAQFFGRRVGFLRARRAMRYISLGMAGAAVVPGILQVILFPPNATLLAAAAYLFLYNRKPRTEDFHELCRMIDAKNSDTCARLLPVKALTMPPDTPIKKAIARIPNDSFIVINNISENLLMEYAFTYGIAGTLRDITTATAE